MHGSAALPIEKDDVSLAPLERGDYNEAAVFLEETTEGRLEKSLWLDCFTHWWETNPAMSDTIERGWVIRSRREGIGGFIGNIPVKYSIMGVEKTACAVTSWYVKKEYSRRSLELLIPFLRQAGAELLLDTTPTEKVERMLLKLGFKGLKRRWLNAEAFYPVDPKGFWDYAAVKLSGEGRLKPIMRIAGVLAVPAFKALNIIGSLGAGRSAREEYTSSVIKRFDRRYMFLWKRLRDKGDVMAVRDETQLNWFFFGTPRLALTRKVIEVRCGDALTGYAAAKVVAARSGGRLFHFLELIDMVLPDGEPGAYRAAFEGLVKAAKEDERGIIFIKASPFDGKMEACMKRFGFISRAANSGFLYKRIGGSEGMDDGLGQRFYSSALDGDRCFFP